MPINTVHLATLGHVRRHLNVVAPEVIFVGVGLAHFAGPVGPCIIEVIYIPTYATL